jgi:hypothetical protein
LGGIVEMGVDVVDRRGLDDAGNAGGERFSHGIGIIKCQRSALWQLQITELS